MDGVGRWGRKSGRAAFLMWWEAARRCVFIGVAAAAARRLFTAVCFGLFIKFGSECAY